MRALFRSIGRLAQAPLSVLVTGETGTGKELVARALHRESPRARKPFVALNTAAIPSELLESELFGHEAGAFTGASRRHVGRFEQADGGTLFLDEIGDMPLPLQTRLLRVLAEGEFFRVGGRELIRVDVRVIAATHQPLEALVAEGRFRADLLHRLDVVRLQLPPLRERRDDVPLLAERFLAAAARKLGAPAKRFAAPALRAAARATTGPATCANWRTCAGAWPRWRRATASACADLDAARCVHRQPRASARSATTGSRRSRPGRARSWPRAPTDIHADARARLDRVAARRRARAHRRPSRRSRERLGLGRNTVTRKLGAAASRAAGRSPRVITAAAQRSVTSRNSRPPFPSTDSRPGVPPCASPRSPRVMLAIAALGPGRLRLRAAAHAAPAPSAEHQHRAHGGRQPGAGLGQPGQRQADADADGRRRARQRRHRRTGARQQPRLPHPRERRLQRGRRQQRRRPFQSRPAAPHGKAEAGAHHAGDIDNIVADASGVAHVNAHVRGVSLGGGAANDIAGRAVVVHAAPDDYASQPAGNAGARMACGVITATQ